MLVQVLTNLDNEKVQYNESDVSLTYTVSDHTSSINQQSDVIILSKSCMNLQTVDINDPPDLRISGDTNQQNIVDNDIYQSTSRHPNPNPGQCPVVSNIETVATSVNLIAMNSARDVDCIDTLETKNISF